MADMKPIGIDQTTGQQRTVKSDDSLVDNIGDQIQLAITQVGDYSGNLRNNVQVLFPWDTPIRLSDPASAPTGGLSQDVSWTADGEFVTIAGQIAPFFYTYQRIGNSFIKIADPATAAQPHSSAQWSPDGEILALNSNSAPRLLLYQRSGTTLTRLADPASLPNSGTNITGTNINWSPNGELLVHCGSNTAPTIHIYQREGTTFTLLTNPTTTPGDAIACDFSPCGEFLAISDANSPYIMIYQYNGSTFTKLADPASLPAGVGRGIAWSPDSNYLSIAHDNGSLFTTYQRSGTTFTKLDAPSSVKGGTNGMDVAWFPDSKFLGVTINSAGALNIYRVLGTAQTRIADPSSLPSGTLKSLKWSPDGQFLVISAATPTIVNIYQTTETMSSSGIVVINGVKRAGT